MVRTRRRLGIERALKDEAALIRGIDEKENFSQSKHENKTLQDVPEMINNIVSWKVVVRRHRKQDWECQFGDIS